MQYIGVAFILTGLYFSLKELKAYNKRKEIQDGLDFIYTDLKSKEINVNIKKETFIDSLIFGVGSSTISIFDIYKSINDHEDVLDILEQRIPRTISDATPMEWFSKINELDSNDSIFSYVNLFKGQQAENMALNLLKENGFNASLFDSLTHPDDDVLVFLNNGEEISYSVKCGETSYIKDCIERSSSSKYIINEEAYNDLLNEGLIEKYYEDGIEIINGDFSNEQLTEYGFNALNNIKDSGDISDNIPYIALVLFGVKTFNNLINYKKGKQTEYELGVNIGIDIVRIGAGGIFATGASKVGSIIGTVVAPGVGTIIGGGIGAIVGGIVGCGVFSYMKERFKWGKIIDAVEHFGEKYKYNFTLNMKRNLANKYLDAENIENLIKKESSILQKYKDQLDPYKKDKITIQALLVNEYLQSLKASKHKINRSVDSLHSEIIHLCKKCSEKRNKNDKEQFKFLGELILSSKDLINEESLDNKSIELMNGYKSQICIAKNHPFRFSMDSDEIIQGLLYKKLKEIPSIELEMRLRNLSLIYYSISALLIGMGINFLF